jgi:UDP-N-acetylmuramate: L-alanyl-gamma-D-glutamyl-meso-diaminopimelate ligase
VELDHADIYRDIQHYESAFSAFARLLPAGGFLAVSAAYPNAVDIARASRARVVTYQADETGGADLRPRSVRFSPEGARFEVVEQGRPLGEVLLPLSGLHNVENALGVYAAAGALGLSHEEIRLGFSTFQGVKRRQEVRAELGGVLVVDDFAHHPTAVRETIHAIAARYPSRRLWAVFEPRSNTSRRNIHQREYALAFDGAARATIKVPEKHDKVPSGEELDVGQVVEELRRRGMAAEGESSVDRMVELVAGESRPNDLVLVMSNGSFGGFIEKLLRALTEKAEKTQTLDKDTTEKTRP